MLYSRPTLNCSIDNYILLCMLLPGKIVYFFDLLASKYEHLGLWIKVNLQSFKWLIQQEGSRCHRKKSNLTVLNRWKLRSFLCQLTMVADTFWTFIPTSKKILAKPHFMWSKKTLTHRQSHYTTPLLFSGRKVKFKWKMENLFIEVKSKF